MRARANRAVRLDNGIDGIFFCFIDLGSARLRGRGEDALRVECAEHAH